MSELDPNRFRELFDAEPRDAAAPDNARWVDLYRQLVAMMERQLEETREFAARAPDAVKQYLGRENIAILEEEIATFKRRLARWANTGTSDR